MIPRKDILALPGIAGGLFAVLIGSIIFLFSFASFGRHGVIAPSPAAGGLLYILMGLIGLTGVALHAKSGRTMRMLTIISIIVALAGIALFISFGEWTALAVIILLVIITCFSIYTQQGMVLLLFVGIFGFFVGQEAMVFLLSGWKTWSIQGVLFIFAAILNALSCRFHKLPLFEGKDNQTKSKGYVLYSILSLIVLVSLIFLLISYPDERAASAIYFSEAKLEEGLGRYDAASEIYDRLIDINQSNAAAWQGKGRALMAMGKAAEAQDSYDRAMELNHSADVPFFGQGSNGSVSSGSCDCEAGITNRPENLQSYRNSPPVKKLEASIVSPGDVQAFPRGESINFTGSAMNGKPPFKYIWESSIDGIIGNTAKFEKDDLSLGMHNITLTITDSNSTVAKTSIDIGIAEPSVCGNVNPRPKYYPIDTPCTDIWPNATGNCADFEVCHPELDYIVEDAVNCCDGSPISGQACSYACANSGGDKKKCRGLYIIKAFGPEAKYMSGYALFKSCCSGYPECTRTCGLSLTGTCAFEDGLNGNVKNLSCNPNLTGLNAWKSDKNMSLNSGTIGLLPTHATVNVLHTGVCEDYSAAVTTLLRKAGYSKTEALTAVTGSYQLPLLGEHPGHGYGLVLLPGDTKYHFVDTTGNGEGINLSGVPGYFWFTGCFLGMPVRIKVFDWWVEYCNMTGEYAFNDAGYFTSPPSSCMVGCQNR
ncbi:MAG: tetratricopeptide repeat protein [Methanotrichaceae archaeon]